MLDIAYLLSLYKILLKGVIHVGAHLGQEVPLYRRLNANPILLIEANPKLYNDLCDSFGDSPDLLIFNYAAAYDEGEVDFFVSSFDQSSSILKLHKHKEYHPSIVEKEVIKVQAKRIDNIFIDSNLDVDQFNFLNLDIQGAELMALKGSSKILDHIDAINTEVNFEEVYSGCGLIDQMDDLLTENGFIRVATICPYNKAWGDAFYVKTQIRNKMLEVK